MTVKADFQSSGSTQIVFSGKTYQTTDYLVSITATNSSSGKLVSVTGNLSSMPSGLVYSAQFQFNNTYTASILLLSTNLPLVDDPGNTSTIGIAIVGAGIFGAVRFRDSCNIQEG